MNTTTIDLQALRREVDVFRDENIALYNELVKQNKILCEQLFELRQENVALKDELTRQHELLNRTIYFFGGANVHDHLQKYLTRLAATQTAEFIVENMPTLKTFDDRAAYLPYVLNFADNSSDGLYLEFGVFKGESVNLISSTVPDKIVYGFDSFEGLPEDWRYDSPKSEFSLNGNMPQVNANVRLVKGWFNETLPAFVESHPQKCAFIHVDCDLYSSTKIVFGALKNKIVSGTVIAFDEYFNYPGWQEGEYKAFKEFVVETSLQFEYIARTNCAQIAVKMI